MTPDWRCLSGRNRGRRCQSRIGRGVVRRFEDASLAATTPSREDCNVLLSKLRDAMMMEVHGVGWNTLLAPKPKAGLKPLGAEASLSARRDVGEGGALGATSAPTRVPLPLAAALALGERQNRAEPPLPGRAASRRPETDIEAGKGRLLTLSSLRSLWDYAGGDDENHLIEAPPMARKLRSRRGCELTSSAARSVPL